MFCFSEALEGSIVQLLNSGEFDASTFIFFFRKCGEINLSTFDASSKKWAYSQLQSFMQPTLLVFKVRNEDQYLRCTHWNVGSQASCSKQNPLLNLFLWKKSVQVGTLPRKTANLTTIPSCWNSPQKAQRQRIWRLCETLGETQDYYSDTTDNLSKLSNVLLQSNVGLSEKYLPRMLLRWALRCFGRFGSRILMFTTGRSPTFTPSPLRTGGFWRRKRKWNDALFLKICSLVSKWQGSLLTEIDDKVDQWNFFLSEGI